MLRLPDPGIEREIRRATPDDLFPFWDSRFGRWRIVKEARKHIPGLTIYDPVSGRHLIVELTLEDEFERPIELTSATVSLVKLLLRERDWFSDPGKHSDRDDEAEEFEIRKAIQLVRLMQLEFRKKLRKLSQTTTVS